MQNRTLWCIGLVGLLACASVVGGCSDTEGIAVGAAIGALAGYAVSSLDDGEVEVRSYSYTSYGYGPRWYGHSHSYGWGGYSRHWGYGHWDRGWGWRGPRSAYRCNY